MPIGAGEKIHPMLDKCMGVTYTGGVPGKGATEEKT